MDSGSLLPGLWKHQQAGALEPRNQRRIALFCACLRFARHAGFLPLPTPAYPRILRFLAPPYPVEEITDVPDELEDLWQQFLADPQQRLLNWWQNRVSEIRQQIDS